LLAPAPLGEEWWEVGEPRARSEDRRVAAGMGEGKMWVGERRGEEVAVASLKADIVVLKW
jgi:hypothetical protein